MKHKYIILFSLLIIGVIILTVKFNFVNDAFENNEFVITPDAAPNQKSFTGESPIEHLYSNQNKILFIRKDEQSPWISTHVMFQRFIGKMERGWYRNDQRIFFNNETPWILMSDMPLSLLTSNDGKIWEQRELSSESRYGNVHFGFIHFINEKGYLVISTYEDINKENLVIFDSSDNGLTWEEGNVILTSRSIEKVVEVETNRITIMLNQDDQRYVLLKVSGQWIIDSE